MKVPGRRFKTSRWIAAAIVAAICSDATYRWLSHEPRLVGRARAAWRFLKAPPQDPPRQAALRIRCDLPTHSISRLIFGVAGPPPASMGATAERFGGNAASRYNWELGDAWNTAADWYFRNVELSHSYHSFLDAGRASGRALALTVPTLGWVAKDRSSYSFPVSVFGRQQASDPENPDMGNGMTPDGRPLVPGPPDRTSVAAPPAWVKRWVESIRREDLERGGRSVTEYILDNEPGLWNSTHRDVHPAPVSYDELLERTIAYGAAVRTADPGGLIAGPAAWGYWEYFYSAVDHAAGLRERPDRLAHGDVPLLAYYLRKLREYETRSGVRLLDVLDVHFYPQATGVFASGGGGGTDPETAALRLRSTRALWDPDYADESWIADSIALLPRLQELIREEYPGTKLSIGEWSFGAEGHLSGGLAVAEALGRFAEFGVYSAFYWVTPSENSAAYWGFRAFRNYDDQGGHFLDIYVPSDAAPGMSSFASRDASHVVAIVTNLNPRVTRTVTLDLPDCGNIGHVKLFRYAGSANKIAAVPEPRHDQRTLTFDVPLQSLAVLEIELE